MIFKGTVYRRSSSDRPRQPEVAGEREVFKCNPQRVLIWKMLLVAEQRFRRLKAPELMKDVYQGAKYVNGVPVNQVPEEKAA